MVCKPSLRALLVAAISAGLAASAKPPAKFNLKTVLLDGDTSKNNLYLTTYHTGAGTADAVLAREKPKDPLIYLNGTQIEFAQSKDFQTWLHMSPDLVYASWNPVTVDSVFGPSSGGFYFNDSASQVDRLGVGLKWNPDYPYRPPPKNSTGSFGGWYACDWYHDVPQLFWIVRYDQSHSHRISTCSKVELVREKAN